MFVLDTDHYSLMEWSESPARQNLLRRLTRVPPNEVFTTIITYEEQTRGWMAYAARARTVAQEVEAYRKLERHMGIYRLTQVLGFDEGAGAEFQRLRAARVRMEQWI
jgi:tRNA(fMet)-specific endonuclease VapC